MTIESSVTVPQQAKELDTAQVSTGAGPVHRQVVVLGDPDDPDQRLPITDGKVSVQIENASLPITAAALPLPTGASTSALQTTSNALQTSANALHTANNALLTTIDGSIDDIKTALSDPLPLPSGAASEATLTALSNKIPVTADPALAIALGLVSGFDMFNKYGQNLDVDIGTEDVWSVGGVYAEPATATTLSVVSTSASDAAAGTGIRTIFIGGLDGSYNDVSETVTLNGTTPVVTVNQYIAVNQCFGTAAGTTGAAVGTITVTSAAAGTPVLSGIPAGEGNATAAIYTVPAGKTAYIMRFGGSMYSGGGAAVTLLLRIKRFGGVAGTRYGFTLFESASTLGFSDILPYIEVPEKSLIKISATATNNNCSVRGNFSMYVVDN